jgi:sulfur relay (sulfurtransferase) DsrC/TusE family protein
MLKPPEEVGEFLHALQREPADLERIIGELRTWNDEALAALDELAREREAEMAELRCSVIGILRDRYVQLGLTPVEARVKATEILHESPDMAEKMLRVWDRFIRKGIRLKEYPLLRLTNFVIASEHPQPVKALEYVEELKERGLAITTRKQRQLQRAGLPEPKRVAREQALKSCYACAHLAKAPEEAVLQLLTNGEVVATGDGSHKPYCVKRKRMLDSLGAPIEVAEVCQFFEWKEE